MRAYLVFTGTGPILVLTTYPDIGDARLVEKLRQKGIAKFIAYEVPLDRVKRLYGTPFDVIASDLEQAEDMRVLDFNGHHIFCNFSLQELGEPLKYGD
ncbi:MAG: hypothetical protein LJE95_02910 [Acidobacteria bacterium]|jgi:hypothetical protein|nr:hypothetical protein [Acidobacteriota bacterium]